MQQERLPLRALVPAVALVVACSGASRGPQAPPTTGGTTAVATTAPSEQSAEFLAGVAAFDGGDYAAARTHFEAAHVAAPGDYQALWNLGQTCEKLGDGASAAAAYSAEIAIKPDADRAVARLASLYVAAGNIDRALATANEGLANHPGSAAIHAALGLALATRGEQDGALHQFEQAVELGPTDPQLHYVLAVWLNRWKVRGAQAHLDVALPLVQNDYAMVVSIGHEYRMAGAFDACARTFDAAIKTRDGGEVRTERALCKLGLKDESGALADLKSAVATEPGYAQGHFFLAGRLASAGRYTEAAVEYAAYLQLAPNGSLAEQANERLLAAQQAASQDKRNKKVASSSKRH